MQKVNIKEELSKLVRLQEIDSRLYNLKREREENPKVLETLTQEFEEKKQVLKEFEEKLKSMLLKRKGKEGELASREESIKKLQSQLYTLKTNKEYSAMISEISGVKMDKSLIEEEILKIFEEQDVLKIELKKKQSQIKEEEKKINEEKQKILNQIKEIETQIAEFESKRTMVEKEIDQKLLSQYNRILKSKDGLAIVKVKNNSCQGCYMNVTHQVVNEIKMYDKLIICGMCARILYNIDEDEPI